MSDLEHSTITYTSISSDYEEPSDVGSLEVVVYGYDELPMHPPSLDYVPAEDAATAFAVYPTADLNHHYITEGEDEEEEEEHLAPADSVLPPQTGTRGARITVRPQPPMAAYTEALIAAIAATLPLPSPPPSPLTSYSSLLPQIPSPLLPISPTHPLGYRAAMIRLRTESPSTSHPIPLPPPIILLRTRASMVLMRAVAPSTYILAPRSGTPPSGTSPLLPIPLPTSSPPLLHLYLFTTPPRRNTGVTSWISSQHNGVYYREI
ncbi:hypothetical protein Tco_0004908 [Tanacetum coccineum]